MPNKNHAKTKSAPRPNPKSLRLALILLILFLVVGAVVITTGDQAPKKTGASSTCGTYRTDRILHINKAAFNTEVASNSDEFNKGLGGRPCILANQAMLFAFKQPGQYAFWMKDMKFPIDMVWIGADSKVVGYYNNISPSTYPDKFENETSRPAKYVLEIKALRAKELGIKLGTPVSF
jgi:uncharacterized protein